MLGSTIAAHLRPLRHTIGAVLETVRVCLRGREPGYREVNVSVFLVSGSRLSDPRWQNGRVALTRCHRRPGKDRWLMSIQWGRIYNLWHFFTHDLPRVELAPQVVCRCAAGCVCAVAGVGVVGGGDGSGDDDDDEEEDAVVVREAFIGPLNARLPNVDAISIEFGRLSIVADDRASIHTMHTMESGQASVRQRVPSGSNDSDTDMD